MVSTVYSVFFFSLKRDVFAAFVVCLGNVWVGTVPCFIQLFVLLMRRDGEAVCAAVEGYTQRSVKPGENKTSIERLSRPEITERRRHDRNRTLLFTLCYFYSVSMLFHH